MDEEELNESRENMATLEKDYEELSAETDDIEVDHDADAENEY